MDRVQVAVRAWQHAIEVDDATVGSHARWRDAQDAWLVAADACEEIGDSVSAEQARGLARAHGHRRPVIKSLLGASWREKRWATPEVSEGGRDG